MPFDMTPIDTPLARRRQLIDALRGDMRGWTWNFLMISNNHSDHRCATAGCAMGYAMVMWPEQLWFGHQPKYIIAKFLGLTEEQASLCFGFVGYAHIVSDSKHVTPAMVADRLEQTIVND